MIEADGVRWRLETHAIVSAEGRIADAHGAMPPCLIVAEDQRRFRAALEGAALTVLGREGHERHPPGTRRRLVLTTRVASLAREGDAPTREGFAIARDATTGRDAAADRNTARARAVLWNPAGAGLAEALAAAAPGGGTVVVAGGTRVMTLLLPATDRFDLVVARNCSIPDGRPCLEGTRGMADLRAALVAAGLRAGAPEPLEPGVTLHPHLREPDARAKL